MKETTVKEHSLPLYNIEGKEIDSVKLDNSLFDGSVNNEAIYQAVNAFRANQRTGLASTKTRGEVSGGGKKPWKQKGTGRARVGSIRSPLWRHGGVIFGPHPRDFSYNLPKKLKDVSLKSALNEKLKENRLMLLNEIPLDEPKTKHALMILKSLKVAPAKNSRDKRVLLLVDKLSDPMKLSFRNIGFLSVNLAKETNVYEILVHNRIILTRAALAELTKRFKKA